jgi:hypothetical protein
LDRAKLCAGNDQRQNCEQGLSRRKNHGLGKEEHIKDLFSRASLTPQWNLRQLPNPKSEARAINIKRQSKRNS